MQLSQWWNCRLAIASMLLMLPSALWASDTAPEKLPWETFALNVGYFLSNVDSAVRIGSGLGIDIDVEDALGLEGTNSVFRVGGLWRFSKNRRHRLDVNWFSLHRSADRQILEDIVIEKDDGTQITIASGTAVETTFNLDIYQAGYRYSFIQDDRLDLAFMAGLYVMPIEVGLSVSGLVNERGTAKFTAPLPVVGFGMDIAISPRWFIRTGTEAFYVEYENFTGSIVKANAAVEFKPWKHVGLGLGFDTLTVNIKADEEDWPEIDLNGKVQFKYTGLQAYITLFY